MKWSLSAAVCALLLAGCSSDGLTVGAGTGLGASVGSSQGTPPNNSNGSGSGSGSSGSTTVGSTGDGSGSGTGTGGTGTSGGTSLLGNGTVTVTAGGTTATTPAVLNGTAGNLANSVANKADGKATSLLTTGNALLPTGTTGTLQSATSGLPASANVANASLGGAATQPVGVSVLSQTQAPGSVATVGVLSAGQTGTVTVNPSGASAVGTATSVLNGQSSLANATVGHDNIITGNNPLVGASAVSPTQNQGSLATVGVASNGQPVTANLGTTNLAGKVTGPKKVGPTPQALLGH